MSTKWTAEAIPTLSGRTFVVTGANSGLGLETTRLLTGHGAHVVMTARDRIKGEAAAARIGQDVPGASLELRILDLADLDSVRAFAAGLHDDKVGVDVLINNAGVMMTPPRKTKQGFEMQFGTNHLGHFALTGLLLDLLAERDDPRVVTVSSTLHKQGRMDFDDLMRTKRYQPTQAYAQSKLANLLFGLELQRRLSAAGSPVRSLMAHPGYSRTNLQFAGPTGLRKAAMYIANPLFAQSPTIGVLPQVRAAVAPDVVGGQYYGCPKLMENRGYPELVQPSRRAQDAEAAARLWTESEKLTGVEYSF
ncbi:SDR family oxidoreductase [Catenulispora sp. NF23]|uniref:SDR family oxidoreductase n=1 Tax=Catenulispora pinistramenti TaxID=2705254 RepID=A0ABS5L0F5_9ACTN|nr:oxidoreductase [Catenulispora pinistramenti]MBS2537329.1 SDR family oxidoreductase [Catenulispora pinistramenti]MBS2551717.1 SDR family oxidoreductase [Catenulispora pinistramenti]